MLPGVLRAVTRMVRGGGVGGGGVPCVDRRHLRPRTWCYLGVQFNLISQSAILGPIPAPVPAGDWGAELRGSSISRTLQWKLRCIRLPTPVIEKGVIPFYLK